MKRHSRGPLARSSLSPSFPSTESIDGAVSSSERSAPSGAYSTWKSNFSPRRRDFSLDNLICQCSNILVLDVEVIQSPQAAAAALDPVRARLLAELSEPASAATLAARLSLPRQKVNYHLRALESHHLVRPTSERKWGGITERLVEATASSYVVSPAAMGPAASDPGRSRDRLSAGYLIALAARVVREVSELATRARETGKRLATLSIDTEIRFRSAAERAQCSSELTAAITQLAARYHDASALGGRTHRLVLVAHPLPQKNKETAVRSEEHTSELQSLR